LVPKLARKHRQCQKLGKIVALSPNLGFLRPIASLAP
jgi:hypothetical protein